MSKSAIYIVGTCDTKAEELSFIQHTLQSRGARTKLVDVSTGPSNHPADVSPDILARYNQRSSHAASGSKDRGFAITLMGEALTAYLSSQDDVAGIVAIGGSGGTALVAPALQALPIGVPKVLVSTVASGNVAPYVGASDIMMMYSVTDIAGINPISAKILTNAANAVLGMSSSKAAPILSGLPMIGLTMFGVTTPCVQAIRSALKHDYDSLVFHATGTGGMSFEKLVDSGFLSAVVDVTTTEICDLIAGGVFAATEDRLGAFARTGIPYVGSCGALDMVNFGAPHTIPEKYRERLFYNHNANVTLMRTTPAECERIGTWIAHKLNKCPGLVRFLIPEGGVSAISGPGQPFHDPEADVALFDALERNFQQTSTRQIIRTPYHINSPEFVEICIGNLRELLETHNQSMVVSR